MFDAMPIIKSKDEDEDEDVLRVSFASSANVCVCVCVCVVVFGGSKGLKTRFKTNVSLRFQRDAAF